MNLASLILAAIVMLIFWLAVKSMITGRKSGCGCGCSSCSQASMHRVKKEGDIDEIK